MNARIIKRRPIGEWAAAALVVLVALYFVTALANNPAISGRVILEYLFDPAILLGAQTTVVLTVMVMVFASVLGLALAFMRMSRNSILFGAAWLFIWVFRSVPTLVWLLFWYFLAALIPTLRIGLPFFQPLVEVPTNDVIGQTGAAILGLGLTEAAYLAEIIRGAVLSVGTGQRDAAWSLGMTRARAMFVIILPQAFKAILPAAGNQVIAVLKATSLVLVIGIPDLMTSVQMIYTTNFLQIPLLIVACIWYLILTSVLSVVQHQLERYANRGDSGIR
ncbi:MAG: amino acid ABC transporter permease [Burkholderiales bacterium]|nr:amino acid ABC transporter permease [Burkholderiales bacterium]